MLRCFVCKTYNTERLTKCIRHMLVVMCADMYIPLPHPSLLTVHKVHPTFWPGDHQVLPACPAESSVTTSWQCCAYKTIWGCLDRVRSNILKQHAAQVSKAAPGSEAVVLPAYSWYMWCMLRTCHVSLHWHVYPALLLHACLLCILRLCCTKHAQDCWLGASSNDQHNTAYSHVCMVKTGLSGIPQHDKLWLCWTWASCNLPDSIAGLVAIHATTRNARTDKCMLAFQQRSAMTTLPWQLLQGRKTEKRRMLACWQVKDVAACCFQSTWQQLQ